MIRDGPAKDFGWGGNIAISPISPPEARFKPLCFYAQQISTPEPDPLHPSIFPTCEPPLISSTTAVSPLLSHGAERRRGARWEQSSFTSGKPAHGGSVNVAEEQKTPLDNPKGSEQGERGARRARGPAFPVHVVSMQQRIPAYWPTREFWQQDTVLQ